MAYDNTAPVAIRPAVDVVKVKRVITNVSFTEAPLTNAPLTEDAVGDRLLFINGNNAGNGIYVKSNAEGDVSRSSDADTAAKITGIVVQDESTGKRYQMITPAPITLDTTNLIFDDQTAQKTNAAYGDGFSNTPPVAIAQS